MIEGVTGENFLSWKKLEFFINHGITLIEGWNEDDQTSEGSGKSAIFNAICWGLYGQLPKDAKVDDVIREGEKHCHIQVHMLLPQITKIVRSRKPNDLYMVPAYGYLEDGEEDEKAYIRGKDAKETQKLIDEALGMSFETFLQAVYFAQNYPKKFINANEAEKVKILSELQDLSIFDIAGKKAFEKSKSLSAELREAEHATKEALYKDSMLASNIENTKADIKTFQDRKQAKLEALEKDVLEAAQERDSIERRLASLAPVKNMEKLEKEYNAAKKEHDELNAKIAVAKQQIKMIEEAKKDKKCPTCKQALPKADCGNLRLPDISKYESQKEQIDEIFNNAFMAMEAAEAELSTRKDLERELISAEKNMTRVNRMYAEAKAEDFTQALQERLQNFEEAKKKSVKLIEASEKKEASLKAEVATYDILRQGFKDVKSYTFKSLLNELNRRVNMYLVELFEVPTTFEFYNDGEEGEISKILSKVKYGGQERPLGLFSGGQARRLQLAVDLALSDITCARNDKPVNLLILDEYFKDLSEESMGKVLNLLEKLGRKTLVIEHNSVFKNIVQNTVKVELVDGISRMAR